MNDNDSPAGPSAEALAIAEQKLQLEQDKKVRDARIDAGAGTEPGPKAPTARSDARE